MDECACKNPSNSGVHTAAYCGPRFKIQTRANCRDYRISDMLGDKRVAVCYNPRYAHIVCTALNSVTL